MSRQGFGPGTASAGEAGEETEPLCWWWCGCGCGGYAKETSGLTTGEEGLEILRGAAQVVEGGETADHTGSEDGPATEGVDVVCAVVVLLIDGAGDDQGRSGSPSRKREGSSGRGLCSRKCLVGPQRRGGA